VHGQNVRDSLKVLMAVLALVGITGMYLSQIRRNEVLGLVGYVRLRWRLRAARSR
jgi:hypothetical protein